MINSYIPLEEIKDDLKKFSKEDLEQAMKKVDEDFIYTKQKEMYEKLKTKLESIRASGDKGELWNFEAGFLLGVLEGAEMNKKIAEKLAEEIKKDVVYYDSEGICFCEIIGDYGKCFKHNKGANCIQCIIDWARKEVESGK